MRREIIALEMSFLLDKQFMAPGCSSRKQLEFGCNFSHCLMQGINGSKIFSSHCISLLCRVLMHRTSPTAGGNGNQQESLQVTVLKM